jgi:hypothetical protein
MTLPTAFSSQLLGRLSIPVAPLSMISPTLFRLTALAALTLATSAARADLLLSENFSASLAGDTTLGGVALGSITEFSFQATFNADPAASLQPGTPGVGIYPVTALSITIAGHGTFSASLDTPLFVPVVDPSNNTFPFYFGGLFDGSSGFLPAFTTATPAINANAPSPTVFDDAIGFLVNGPMTIGLTSVPDGLAISNGGVVGTISVSLTSVPEPATCGLVAAGGLLAFAGWRRRR